MDGELDASVLQRLLGDGVAFLACLEVGSFYGVRLKEGIKTSRLAPCASSNFPCAKSH